MKPILIVDVDDTIIDMNTLWLAYCKEKTGMYIDLSMTEKEVKKLERELNVSIFDFWKNPHLYDNLQPMYDAEEVLNKYKDDFDIVFCSNAFSEHLESKKHFLKRYFSHLNYKFINTAHKEYIYGDIIIDNYEKVIRKNRYCKLPILYKTDINKKGKTWYEIDLILAVFLKSYKEDKKEVIKKEKNKLIEFINLFELDVVDNRIVVKTDYDLVLLSKNNIFLSKDDTIIKTGGDLHLNPIKPIHQKEGKNETEETEETKTKEVKKITKS